MNKKTIITSLLALIALTGQAQEIKRVTTKPENFMEHMNMYGYKVFTYDISSLRDVASCFTIVIREYDKFGMIDEKKLEGFRTRTMISDFDEEDQRVIYAKKNGDDMEHGIYRLSKTLSIGFSPVQSDSIELVTIRSGVTMDHHIVLPLNPFLVHHRWFIVTKRFRISLQHSNSIPLFPLSFMVLSGGIEIPRLGVFVVKQN